MWQFLQNLFIVKDNWETTPSGALGGTGTQPIQLTAPCCSVACLNYCFWFLGSRYKPNKYMLFRPAVTERHRYRQERSTYSPALHNPMIRLLMTAHRGSVEEPCLKNLNFLQNGCEASHLQALLASFDKLRGAA